MTTTSTIPFQATCDLYDQYLDKARVPTIHWKSYGKISQFCGRAVTIKCFEDNSRVKELVEQQAPTTQSVLIVDGGGSVRCALLGDMLAHAAVMNKWKGIIVYGCVRDVDELKTLDIGILALGHLPRKSTRRGEGQTNLPIQLGDVMVQPGDVVFADNDGVLILDPDHYYL